MLSFGNKFSERGERRKEKYAGEKGIKGPRGERNRYSIREEDIEREKSLRERESQ